MDKKEVKHAAAQDEQHTVEVLPRGFADDGGQDQKHGYESHQDGDEKGHLQAEQQVRVWPGASISFWKLFIQNHIDTQKFMICVLQFQ